MCQCVGSRERGQRTDFSKCQRTTPRTFQKSATSKQPRGHVSAKHAYVSSSSPPRRPRTSRTLVCIVRTGAAPGHYSPKTSPLRRDHTARKAGALCIRACLPTWALCCSAVARISSKRDKRGNRRKSRAGEDEQRRGDAGAGVRGRGARRPGAEELDAGPRPPAPQPHRRELRQGRGGKHTPLPAGLCCSLLFPWHTNRLNKSVGSTASSDPVYLRRSARCRRSRGNRTSWQSKVTKPPCRGGGGAAAAAISCSIASISLCLCPFLSSFVRCVVVSL